MTEAVEQPTARPTNKLTAATAASALMGVLYWALDAVVPSLPNEQLITGLTPVAVMVAGWFIKDRPNTGEV